jgi:hypothetical protein
MLAAVNFDNDASFEANEIKDVIFEWDLSAEFQRGEMAATQ